MREQRLSEREVEALPQLRSREVTRREQRRALAGDAGTLELGLPRREQLGAAVNAKVVPGLEMVHEAHTAAKAATANIEQVMLRGEALAHEEVELELSDLLPLTADSVSVPAPGRPTRPQPSSDPCDAGSCAHSSRAAKEAAGILADGWRAANPGSSQRHRSALAGREHRRFEGLDSRQRRVAERLQREQFLERAQQREVAEVFLIGGVGCDERREQQRAHGPATARRAAW